MTEQELRLHARIIGARETADEIEKIGEAQGKLNRQVDDGGKPLEDLDEKQKAVKASASDYSSLLSRIHPQLGAFAAGMINAVRISGDLANQQINLRGAFRATTTAIRNNWNALKLIGAGGLATAGIMALMGAIRAMREEWERATAAIKRHQEALNDLKRAEQDRQKQIEAVSDVRRGGGLTAEASRRVAQNVEAIRQQMPAIEESSLVQMAGLMGDQLTRQQLTQAAILHQQGLLPITPTMGPEAMMRGFERQRERFGERIDAFLTREAAQGETRAAAARNAATSARSGAAIQEAGRLDDLAEAARKELVGTGSTLNLKKFIEEIVQPPAGTDIDELIEKARKFGTSGGLREALEREKEGQLFKEPSHGFVFDWLGLRPSSLERGMTIGGVPMPFMQLSSLEENLIQQIFQRIAQVTRQSGQQVNVTVQHNGRYYERSGRTPKIRQLLNGETLLESLERF